MRSPALTALLAVVLVSGCAADTAKPSVDDVAFTELAGLDTKSDAFSARMTLLGELTNDAAQTVEYTAVPQYRGFKLAAQMGDHLDAKVVASTAGADSFLWLLGEDFAILAKNDDGGGGLDSRVRATITRTGTYYLVFRELYDANATFVVSVSGLSAQVGPVASLAAFNQLSDEAKLKVLYPDYDGPDAWNYELAPEFTALPLRIVDELTGTARSYSLEVYRDLRTQGYANGATEAPTVEKLVRGGSIWAIAMTSSGRSYGNWVRVVILDAAGNEIGGWSQSD